MIVKLMIYKVKLKFNLLNLKTEYKNALKECSSTSKRNFQILFVMFCIGLSIMVYIIYSLPALSEYLFILN